MSAAVAMRLRLATVACHSILIATLVASVLETRTVARAALALALVAPLLVTLRGLVRGPRASLPWLAVLLVVYVGGASVEVIARGGHALPVNAMLLAAVLELALLLALIRRSRPRAPSARE